MPVEEIHPIHKRRGITTVKTGEGISLVDSGFPEIADWLVEIVPTGSDVKCEIHTHFHIGDRTKALAVSKPETDALVSEFNERADRWERETGIYSSPTKRFLHEDYQIIMTMGEPVVPLILKRLKTKPSDWFWALKHFARRDVAAGCDNFQDAANAWLAWGAEKY